MTGGALYYLLGSDLAIGAFFMLIDMVERWRDRAAPTGDRAATPPLRRPRRRRRHSLDDDEAL